MLKSGPARWALIACVAALTGAASVTVASIVSPAPDGVVEVLWLVGWVLLAWSTIAAIAVGATLWRARRAGPPATASLLLLAASITLVVAAGWLHPLFGSGGGSA